jgi:hypothetical protein
MIVNTQFSIQQKTRKMKKINKAFLVTYNGNDQKFKDFREIIEAKNEREAVERMFHKFMDSNYFPNGKGFIFDSDQNVLAEPGDQAINWDGGYFIADLIFQN